MEDGLADKRLGRYRLVREIGTGAMGEVYLADDEMLGRQVAIKTIRPRGLTGATAAIFRSRFSNEAKAAAALSHPNIVNVFDIGVDGNTPFLVMEVVSGRSLKARLEEARLSASEARVLGIQIARALDAAHGRGIVHRDVKPANILEHEGSWKLADFGIARVPASSLTLTGQFLGSPAYAAPEAIESGEQTARGDVYSLGATLYEALTGESPHGERGLASVVAAVAKRDPAPIAARMPDLPPDLAGAIMRALARDPCERPTAAALADELAGVAASRAPIATARRSRTRAAWVAAAVVLVGLVIAGVANKGQGAATDASRSAAGEPVEVSPVPDVGSSDHEKRWRRVQEKLEEGEYRDAREELKRLLERYPDDSDARALFTRIKDEAKREGKRKHRHRDHDD